MSEANDNPFGKTYLGFLFVSVVRVFMVSLLLPFPISMAVSIIILLCVCVIRADIAVNEAGMAGIKGWYRFLTSSESGRRYTDYLLDPIKFSCMNCR